MRNKSAKLICGFSIVATFLWCSSTSCKAHEISCSSYDGYPRKSDPEKVNYLKRISKEVHEAWFQSGKEPYPQIVVQFSPEKFVITAAPIEGDNEEKHGLVAAAKLTNKAKKLLETTIKRVGLPKQHFAANFQFHQEGNPAGEQIGKASDKFNSERYASLLAHEIRSVWELPNKKLGKLQASLTVEINAGGQLVKAELAKSSGDQSFDHSALKSVKDASPFLAPADGSRAPLKLSFDFEFHIAKSLDEKVKPAEIYSIEALIPDAVILEPLPLVDEGLNQR